jgi:argininosuccinate synthase
VKLLTGNDLPTGDVIWWTGNTWSRQVTDAADVGEGGNAVQAAEEAARRVNASYIIDAENGVPAHIKDRVRAAGPTVRTDLGVNPTLRVIKG